MDKVATTESAGGRALSDPPLENTKQSGVSPEER